MTLSATTAGHKVAGSIDGHLPEFWPTPDLRVIRFHPAEGGHQQDYPTLYAAKKLGGTSMMLPAHPTLESSDIDPMIETVGKVFQHAGR